MIRVFATVSFLIIAYVVVLLFIFELTDGIRKMYHRKIVGNLIANSFDKTPLTTKQIEILATNSKLTIRDVQILLRNQFFETVKSSDKNAKINYFQELLEEFKKNEPFECLPLDIKLHLERIRETLGKEKYFLLEPLVSVLQDLNSNNKRKQMRMLALNLLGLIVSLLFGVIPYIPK